MTFTADQFKALYARIDNLQAAGLKVAAIEVVRGIDNEMIVFVDTSGSLTQPLPDNYGNRFIVSQQANVRNAIIIT